MSPATGLADLTSNDLEFKRRNYDNDKAYRQSKQADRMLSAAFAEKLKPFQITVNACHPGDVNSVLSNNLGFAAMKRPSKAQERQFGWRPIHWPGDHRTLFRTFG